MARSQRDALANALEAFWRGLESANSRRGYRQVWAAFEVWLAAEGLAALNVKPSDMQRYVTHLRDAGKAQATRAWALSALRSIYDSLTVNGLIPVNPARSVKNPRTSQAPRAPWLEEDDVRKLLGVLNDTTFRGRRDRLCVLLFLGLGWRRAEIARMHVEHFQNGTVTGIVKGGKIGTVAVPEWLQGEIRAWCEYAGITSGPLLLRSAGSTKGVSANTVYNCVVNAAKRAGVKASPHALRRTFITTLRGRGADLKALQLAVVHSSSVTTERYDRGRRLTAPGEGMRDLVYGQRDRER
jgi:site-specific recombinase XerD